ncbi:MULTISPECIES: acyl-CoA dehydrogenase family protein [unclassified Chelatococcus]|uniref:acyl-CoA dehydrogenase family protein n=1 Tax=unclassified Chelatococcus TaxID=2638111 RepID=UPI001BCABAF9|nr:MULTISPECIES: acyl-CoA dehydrogenase family protein [unclassified Chelatococcus]CAH1648257.1 Butyryl-CoA dehydrogenase [Hyphomicrobiales bacterium]MBS7742021.1 acyl-CoA dehydrogenase family protein [Chelatococcus sp. HY11]MBX3541181.1 acyl-CoA dehydrogenase family protein [Chelatococcus sp.]MCO5074926.1 acyl-CoA dehydrogenase family protein [Chelatococcus sp.]CAH1690622.1 Butyryl-CoA dehydrogenase [Hyphomicrobiales bacterium]
MDFQLTADQREMVNTVRAVTQEKIKPRSLQYMDGSFPWDSMKDLASIGVLGMAVPEEYGGSGLSVLDTALVLEEVAKGCYVTAMALMGEVGVQVRIISTYAPEAIKQRILPGVCTGENMLAVCMTEPHAGTDVANYRTNTDIVGDKLVLNGTKTLISRVDEAQMFVVFTRINKQPGREGIGCVLIERDTPGFQCTARYHTMGGENLAEITFENCELPLENLVIREDGFRRLLSAFNTQRCLNPSVSLGLAEGAFEEAVKYCRDRTAFKRPIGEFQGMRWKLAEMYRDIEIGRSILYRACATANPFPDPYQAALAKMYCNEMAIRVTSEAIQVHGGYGFTDEYPVSRFYRGARYGTLGGGTTETLKELVGKKIMADFPHDGFLGMGSF